MSRLLLVVLGICVTPAISANGDEAVVEHVVIAWLKEPGNPAARERVLEGSRALAAIPGVLSIKAGVAIPSARPVVDSSFDVALVITFTDTAAMQHYLDHPLHEKLKKEVLKPLVERIQVYDFSDRSR